MEMNVLFSLSKELESFPIINDRFFPSVEYGVDGFRHQEAVQKSMKKFLVETRSEI